MMTCNNNIPCKDFYKDKKNKKSYANILLKNHSASTSHLYYPDFPKRDFLKEQGTAFVTSLQQCHLEMFA